MGKQPIASISNGLVELESGAVFELDSQKGSAWLESTASFRFIPSSSNAPYTARKESGKGGDYWYGYRKVAGKLHKKYVGKTSDLNTAKLEEVAEALNTPPEPRQLKVTEKVTHRVTERVAGRVTDKVTDKVTGRVTDKVTDTRISALEEQIKILQESVQALQDVLPGKLRA